MALGAQTLRQQLTSIPILSRGTICPDGSSVVDSILHWLTNGVKTPLCIFQNGRGAAFVGKDGRLYTLRFQLGEDDFEEVKLHQIKADEEDWQITDTSDVAAVTVAHAEHCILVLDSKMELHVRQDDGSQDDGLSEEVTLSHLGRSTLVEAVLPRPLPGRRVAQVACSEKHFLALTTDGVVHSCGSNSSGQLGLGHTDFNMKMAPVHLEKNSSGDRFAIFVACGSEHSAVLCEQGTAMTFGSSHDFRLGRRSETWVNPWPMAIEFPGNSRCIRVACGAKHTLFLTATGHLWGCGQGAQRQLGSAASGCVLITELPFSRHNGIPVDIFSHPSLNVSVVLTQDNRFWICGEAGSLCCTSGLIEDFLPYDRNAVIIDSLVVCMKPTWERVNIPGFNDSEVCSVELVAASGSGLGAETAGESESAQGLGL
ncbi:unnamed protein product [Polarella glacialis]|uniref:Uncharacterized protein n=1 Tax=Polarella glacialis TaxID=89957 RepID=A0A813JCC6_POLGL|nr:unnamed protein product [Polarella glacialis]